MAKHFGSCFGHDIGKLTTGDIVKTNENWLSIPSATELCHELDMSRTRDTRGGNVPLAER